MKKKAINKAFTLVELLVVISIVAILATVGILGYSAFIKKANVSNDNSFLAQLNVYVKAEAVNIEDEDYKYVEQVNETLGDSFGLHDELLRPSAKNCHYGFDIDKDEFVLINDAKKGDLNVFAFVNSTEDATKMMGLGYSLYLQGKKENYANFPKISVGLDCGRLEFSKITYENKTENAQSVVMYSKGGTIFVDAPKDTVDHYGYSKYLDITSINTTACWNEHGYIPQSQVKRGKIVNYPGKIEVDGEIKDTGVENSFMVANDNAQSFDEIIFEAKTGAKLPNLDRSAVTIPSDGLKVCELITPSADKELWLNLNGTYEQMMVTEKGASTAGSGVVASSAGEEYSKAAQEIANVEGDVKVSISDIEKGSEYFKSGGSGTENNPFLIASYAEFANINQVCYFGKFERSTGYSFKLINDIDVLVNRKYVVSNSSCTLIYFNGCTLDGDGHAINICYYNVIYSTENATFRNLVLNGTKATKSGVVYNPDSSLALHTENNVYENVKITGEFNYTGNCGVVCVYSWGDLEFNNCVSEANINGKAYNAIFVGYQGSTTHVTYTFNNCINRGAFIGERAGMFLANPCKSTLTLYVNNCRNDGIIRQTIMDNEDYYFALNGNYGASSTIIVDGVTITAAQRAILAGNGTNVYGPNDTIKLTVNADKTITFTKSSFANVAYYKVTVMTYVGLVNENGSGRVYMEQTINADSSDSYTSIIKVLPFTRNLNSQYTTAGDLCGNPVVKDTSGNLYYLVENSEYSCGWNDLCYQDYVAVAAYESNGTLLSTTVYSN